MSTKALTLGSLFDGSGGFPLGGLLAGITPVWASEIEPFPIRVTTKRLPGMKHYGDISQMHGGKIEPVDIITFGSPCTDMSVAGKRAGLDGQQSSLFYQAVRIIREMREATNGKYPRFCVWENVVGAYSSNGGKDFKAVLEAVIGIVEPGTEVPPPEKNRWPYADCYLRDGWSVAYRTFDAQHWGVPQRRKRIYLVADFRGECAGKILFESEGVSGYSAESFRAWQRTAGSTTVGIGKTGTICMCDQGGERIDILTDRTATLRAEAHHPPLVLESHPTDSRIKIDESGVVQTLTSRMGTGGEDAPIQEDMSATLSCNNDQLLIPYVKGTRPHSAAEAPPWKSGGVANTLNTFDVGESRCNELVVQAYGICSKDSNAMKSDNPHSGFYEADTSRTLDGNGGNPSCNQGGIAVVESYAIQGSMIGRSEKNGPQGDGINKDVSFTLNTVDRHAVYAATTGHMQVEEEKTPTLAARDFKSPAVVNQGYGVRRLTPTECAKLQGFPPQWCAGLETSEPTAADIAFWSDVWETHRKIVGSSTKPKSRNQIIKWLKNPHSDSAEYKMWGNGVALPNVFFVLAGIVWSTQITGG